MFGIRSSDGRESRFLWASRAVGGDIKKMGVISWSIPVTM
jgi:hypothetical protein